MAEMLTPQQKMAVENRGGKLLVSAAAGSGKTKVLVDRLMKYIMDPVSPCNIDDFLMITYTKAAAAELRGKIAAKLSEHLSADPENRHLQRQMQRLYLAKISTVHSFCTDLLRQHANRLDLAPDFRVGDENECGQLRVQAMEELLEDAYTNWMQDPDFRAFVDTQGLGRDDRLVPEIRGRGPDRLGRIFAGGPAPVPRFTACRHEKVRGTGGGERHHPQGGGIAPRDGGGPGIFE